MKKRLKEGYGERATLTYSMEIKDIDLSSEPFSAEEYNEELDDAIYTFLEEATEFLEETFDRPAEEGDDDFSVNVSGLEETFGGIYAEEVSEMMGGDLADDLMQLPSFSSLVEASGKELLIVDYYFQN